MKNIKKTLILTLATVSLGVAAVGAMANPYRHLRHINYRENHVIRTGTYQIQRAYRHGNYRRAHILTHQMNRRITNLNHRRNHVINHNF